jgi:hypothetical protein
MLYLFKENNKILGIFDDFLTFRKQTCYYIVDLLLENNFFKNKEEAIENMKPYFYDFYSKKNRTINKDEYSWKYYEYEKNTLIDIKKPLKINDKEKINNKNYTIINAKKSSISFKDLNKPLSYLKLSPLYNK